jgi:hypothetical protein
MPAAPTVDGEVTGGMLHAYLELFADAPEVFEVASVAIEVGATEGSPALQRVTVPLRTTDTPGCRVAGGSVSIADLPRGDYMARAVISIGNRRVGQVTRPFKVARPSAPPK